MPNPFRSKRARLLVSTAAALAVLTPLTWFWQASLLPETYDLAEMGYADWGGGPAGSHAGHHGTAVADLTSAPDRTPDVEATLSVREEDGGYTVNGTSPGPVLRATEGDLVEVTLRNEDVTAGTTLHWHGIDVPNAADGVAGVTQDAVGAGEEFVYRFVAEQAGTYWYHSHQLSHEQVRRGLLGAVVIEPDARPSDVVDALALLQRSSSTLRRRLRRVLPEGEATSLDQILERHAQDIGSRRAARDRSHV